LRDIRAVEVEVKDNVDAEKAADILAKMPIVVKVLETEDNVSANVIRLQVENEYEAIPIIAEKIRSLGIKVSAIRQAEPSFEEIFVKLAREEEKP